MSPAQELRAAATLMRGLAADATQGRWSVAGREDDPVKQYIWTETERGEEEVAAIQIGEDFTDVEECNAAHMAAWDPTVALAVADWLDEVAATPLAADDPAMGTTVWSSVHYHALTVARAFLGGAQ
jgi:hypothetical protein